MRTLDLSMLSWAGGGLAGAIVSREHRVLGGILGALVVGTFADATIDRAQAGAWPFSKPHVIGRSIGRSCRFL